MNTFLSNCGERWRSSYWFLPFFLALGAIGLSARPAHRYAAQPESRGTDRAGGAEGARNVLATIASSTITVARRRFFHHRAPARRSRSDRAASREANDRAVLLARARAVRDAGVTAAPNERDKRDIGKM